MKEKEKTARQNALESYATQLVELVSDVCGVGVDEMFAEEKRIHCVHARWMYWYALRYMTGESYEVISRPLYFCTHKYTKACVASGVRNIGAMMAREPLWHKRWTTLKQAIRETISDVEIVEDNTIVISVPKGMRSQFNIVVQEKK